MSTSLRGRIVLGAALLVAVVTSALLLERSLDLKQPAPAGTGEATSGSWSCPHGGGRGWKGWIVLANPGRQTVQVRMTTFRERGTGERRSFELPPMHQTYRAVPVGEAAAATQVEYFGGWVGVASMVGPEGSGTSAASRCVQVSGGRQFLPDQLTRKGQTGFIVVMNPFAYPAEFEVVLRTERRTIKPGPLNPYILKPGRSVGIRLNDYALQSPAEHTLTAEVNTRIGRVVVGGLGMSSRGVRGEAALQATDRSTVIPAADYSLPAELTVVNPGRGRADLVLVGQGENDQQLLSGEEGLSLGGGEVATFDVEREQNGMVVRSSGNRPVAVALRLADAQGEAVTIEGGDPEAAWMILPATADGVGEELILQNPGDRPATAEVSLIGADGPVSAGPFSSLRVGGGRILRLALSDVDTSGPVSALVLATEGRIVAARVASSATSGFAATLGVPLPRWAVSEIESTRP